MQTSFSLPKQPGWIGEFRAFIVRGNVVDLAIGIIIGAAFTGVVGSLVKDVINPIIGLAIGGVDFTNIFVALNGQHYPTLDAAQKAGAPTVNIGVFINALINFVIIAFVVFWVGKAAAPDPPRGRGADRAAGAEPVRSSARGDSRSAQGAFLNSMALYARPPNETLHCRRRAFHRAH